MCYYINAERVYNYNMQLVLLGLFKDANGNDECFI